MDKLRTAFTDDVPPQVAATGASRSAASARIHPSLGRTLFWTAAIWGLLAAAFALSGCSDDDDDPAAPSDPFVFATEPASAYVRVDRMGMPAIATAVISSGNKDAYNDADPTDDADGDFVADIVANVGGLHAALDDDLAGAGLTPCATNDCVSQAAPLVVPDVLRIDVTQAAGFPNGRRLSDPVIDVTLAVVLLDLGTHGAGTLAGLPLNPPANDVPFSTGFPYLAPANP